MTIEQIAHVAHEANRAFCGSIGDNSQLAWEAAPQWQRDSAIEGVKFHATGDHSPSASHEAWLEHKRKDGWKYGPVKDAEKKEHPCFVAYEQLPAEQQAKDYLFRGVVHSLRNFLA